MKGLRARRDEAIPRLFGLTDDSVLYRSRMRTNVSAAVWFCLSALTMVLFIFLAENNIQRLAIIFISFIKYLPMLSVAYGNAKTRAATYLADIFELEDESAAYSFIEEVTFGEGTEGITINEGRISEKDERSPIILIGGPGSVQVNLDSVALLERVNGTPEIIHPRNKPWKLGRFERIREIGKSDEVGKHEYAIINLRDQFVRGLSVKSRTKDGIPIEAQDIKVLFSILRKAQDGETDNNDLNNFEEKAVYSLVYDQIIITPAPSKVMGVSFPWDTTVIPLVSSEMEHLITSRSLSEILSNISIQEIEKVNENETRNMQMRFEMTGEQTRAARPGSSDTPNFESRSKITSQFYTGAFREKAAKLGVAIHWIDIGTWQLPNETIVFEELKNAQQLMRDNARRRGEIERLAKQQEMLELIELVNNVIITNFSKSSSGFNSSRKLSNKEYLELIKLIEENPEIVITPELTQSFSQDAATKRDAATIALEILKAFRSEFIAARELIQKENRSPVEKETDAARIDKAIKDIDSHIFHYVKRPS